MENDCTVLSKPRMSAYTIANRPTTLNTSFLRGTKL